MMASKVLVFDIKRFAIHDGRGLRTTVFFKGCPLRCKWCQNPEGLHAKKQVIYLANQCIHCRICEKTALPGQLRYENNRPYIMKNYQGNYDHIIDACPSGALRYDSEKYTVEELVEIIEQDQVFYRDGGGVTFSGGEPLLQSDFLIDILKKCQQNGIHTCLDTAGFGGTKNEEVLKYTDLVMMDIKALEDEKYEFMTGQKINESFDFLDLCKKMKKRLWIRQVIVPGINDNEEYIRKLKKFLSQYDIEKVEFLPYTTIGVPKYKKLKLKYRLKDTEAMDKEKCDKLYKLYEKL